MNFKIFILFVASIGLLVVSCAGDRTNSDGKYDYGAPPVFFKSATIPSDSTVLPPARLQLYKDTLFVLYLNSSSIDIFADDLVYIKTIELKQKFKSPPVSFVITDSLIIAAGPSLGCVLLFDRQGNFLDSFGLLPDSTTRLSPFGLVYYGGVAYVCDIGVNRVLAVSMTDAEGVTEKGELILEIPADSGRSIGVPSAVYVTFDGRLLVGDAQAGMVHTYTCDGQFIYDFDSVPGYSGITPQAFAIDWMIDPSLQDSNSFDPSGIRMMGRIHMVDSHNGAVHMFNPLGGYIASYPDDSPLEKPSGVAIDNRRRLVYIADPKQSKILVYRFPE